MRRLTAPKTIGTTFAVVVLIVLIASSGAQSPRISANVAMRELDPKMQALDIARATCAPQDGERACSAEDVAGSDAGAALHLRVGSACIAPRAACVRTEGDLLVAELVSRELPGIGGIRLEGRARHAESSMRWTCRPVRGGADPSIVRRACGDIPSVQR